MITYRGDLDGDGTEDLVMKVVQQGMCARGGTFDCNHFFLFGDQPVTKHPHYFNVNGAGNVVLKEVNGVTGITFGSHPDVPNPQFFPVTEIREKTLSARLSGFVN